METISVSSATPYALFPVLPEGPAGSLVGSGLISASAAAILLIGAALLWILGRISGDHEFLDYAWHLFGWVVGLLVAGFFLAALAVPFLL